MTTTYGRSARPVAVPFPAVPYPSAASYAGAYFEELAQAAATIDSMALDDATAVLLDAYTQGKSVFSCGNGGSAAVSNHLQCDHLKTVRNGTDLQSRVISLCSNVELLTAIANDVGYHDSFAYQLRAQSRPGDVLIAISSSGCSPNILHALQWASDNNLRTIALTGFDGGSARSIADIAIHVDSSNYGVVEDLHQSIMHALAQYIRHTRMSADSIASTTF
jgi:phosphoheptose isomerase